VGHRNVSQVYKWLCKCFCSLNIKYSFGS
jgi:hypothetical protein